MGNATSALLAGGSAAAPEEALRQDNVSLLSAHIAARSSGGITLDSGVDELENSLLHLAVQHGAWCRVARLVSALTDRSRSV